MAWTWLNISTLTCYCYTAISPTCSRFYNFICDRLRKKNTLIERFICKSATQRIERAKTHHECNCEALFCSHCHVASVYVQLFAMRRFCVWISILIVIFLNCSFVYLFVFFRSIVTLNVKLFDTNTIQGCSSCFAERKFLWDYMTIKIHSIWFEKISLEYL